MGPVSRLLLDADEATRARVRAAMRASLAPHASQDGRVVLPTATWIVNAVNA
jgi:hypothetical protein